MGTYLENTVLEIDLESDHLSLCWKSRFYQRQHAVSDRTQDSSRMSQSIEIPHICLVLFSTNASAFCVPCPVITKLGLGRMNRALHLSLLNFVLLDWPVVPSYWDLLGS